MPCWVKERNEAIMKHIGALVLAALLAPLTLLHAVTVEDLRCEYRENPLGIDVVKPRLSWKTEDGGQRTEVRGQRQTAYQVLVASSDELLKGNPGDLWDSGKVVSDQSIQVEYARETTGVAYGLPLASAGVGQGWKGVGLE